MRMLRVVAIAFMCACAFLGVTARAAVMQSAQYGLEFDSVNGAGLRSTSASFGTEDTAGELAPGYASSTSYTLHAGYQQTPVTTITLSAPPDVVLTPLTTTQNSAVGNAQWTVTTNNSAGYTLSVRASSTPALVGNAGRQFADLGATPATWSVTSAYTFGFSALGSHVSTATWGTDADCIAGTNVPSATLKWRGFAGTTDIPIATWNTVTSDTGTPTTVCFATEQQGVLAPSDTYTATITATAVTL